MSDEKKLVNTDALFIIPEYCGIHNASQDFTEDRHPVRVHYASGVEAVLGLPAGEDISKSRCAVVSVERRPKGWCVFVTPVNSGDVSLCIYLHDDGRSWVLPEHDGGTEVVSEVPEEID